MTTAPEDHSNRAIVQGVAVTCLFFAVPMAVPIAGIVSAVFMPLPIAYYRQRLGRIRGLLVPLLSTVALIALYGNLTVDAYAFIGLMAVGFILGEQLDKDASVEKAIGKTCAALFLAGAVMLLILDSASGTGVFNLLSRAIRTNIEFTLKAYRDMGVPLDRIQGIEASLDRIDYVLARILPGMTAGAILLITWVNLLVARHLFYRKGLAFPAFGPLNQWSAPEGLVWGVIGSGAMFLVPDTGIRILAANGLLVLLPVYFLQGIAVISHYLQSRQFPAALKVFFYSLIAIQQVLMLVVVVIGIFDMWINFRKLNRP